MSIPRAAALPSLLVSFAIVLGAGSTTATDSPSTDADVAAQVIPPPASATIRNQLGYALPDAPATPDGPADPALVKLLDTVFGGLRDGIGGEAIPGIIDADDARAAWLLSDLVRFLRPGDFRDELVAGFELLTDTDLSKDPVANRSVWQSMTDHLIAWELPALPGYEGWKAQLFTLVEPRWQPFFADGDSDIDWRLVSWGGVFIDDRPLGATEPCERGCIPALDDPLVTDAEDGQWYPDDRYVFGVTVNGESRAYPKHIMEVHEMINDQLGGRRVAIPYCTLCGSAQAYFTDDVPGSDVMPVLRTSGLLSRSNKVMYDLESGSVFDTFTGVALSGPLRDAGVELEQTTVVTSTWADWRAAHPDTTIIDQFGGLGRLYDLDPLGDRDASGAIFPIGDVDERLGAQEKILGIITADGTPLAFPVSGTRAALEASRTVKALGVTVVPDGSGLRATDEDGEEIVAHEAFWFAWSQFYPDTALWDTP